MTAPALVRLERSGAVAIVTLDRPAKRNAWTHQMGHDYFAALDEVEADPEVRALVITGAGQAFCAGADLALLAEAGSADPASATLSRALLSTRDMSIPVVAAVNGAAAGLGLALALAADVRFVEPASRFLTVFARRGLIAEYGVAWLLPRLVGESRALDLLLSGREVRGDEALRIGLADRLCTSEKLVAEAIAYAEDLATGSSPRSMAIVKRQVHDSWNQTFEEACTNADELMLASFREADLAVGMATRDAGGRPEFPPLIQRSSHAV